ncbi:AraC family ligand binding domain-containing protein, partial [Caenispirillum bisanense]|uniref:AraC family ligand binding domain-containing protein n=1 Tax=Caenispirillum bisanense TaxID=414052 RepID=UPI0031CE5C87
MAPLPCALAGVQAVAADTARRFGRHTHDQFGIGLLHRGAQASASGRGAVEATAGDIITVNPGEVHDGSPLGGGARAWRMLYLDPAVVAAAVADLTEDAAGPGARESPAPVPLDGATAAAFRDHPPAAPAAAGPDG